MVALVFLTVLGTLIAVVADVMVEFDASARARTAALVGAQAGGQDVDLGSQTGPLGRGGTVQLRNDAAAVCERNAAAVDPAAQVNCQITGTVVTATVTQRVALPVVLFGLTASVTATAHGGPAVGTVTAG